MRCWEIALILTTRLANYLQLDAGAALCSLWDRVKAKRPLPVDALRKAVRMMVPACINEDRTTPEPHSTFKI